MGRPACGIAGGRRMDDSRNSLPGAEPRFSLRGEDHGAMGPTERWDLHSHGYGAGPLDDEIRQGACRE